MEINYVGKPENTDLPFFAYGIFKPGQIAFYQIKKFCEEIFPENAKYEMRYRDGVAILCGVKNEFFRTKGYLIHFNDNSDEAYMKIGNSEPEELYEWAEIDIGGKTANALIGKDPLSGSFNNREYTLSNYDYRKDSFFNEARILIGECIEKYKQITNITMRDFFIIQMHYMLLWSVIERFCTLKYGYRLIGANKFRFAKERVFKEKLKEIDYEDVAYSSDRLDKKELNPFDYRSIEYYYTIRCNVVHRGKSVSLEDKEKLKFALEDLYGLFESVYLETLRMNDLELRRFNF